MFLRDFLALFLPPTSESVDLLENSLHCQLTHVAGGSTLTHVVMNESNAKSEASDTNGVSDLDCAGSSSLSQV